MPTASIRSGRRAPWATRSSSIGAGGLKLARFEPPRAYCFEGGWFIALESFNGRTRLIARGRFPHGVFSLAYAVLLEVPHFIMERKMLLGIKERAEGARREASS
jgi:hypothetical protein